jgi:glycosyltransferase involved in cell wall biosynthesis
MRAARSPAERLALLDRLARIVTVSDYLRRRLLKDIAAPEGRAPAVLPNCIDLAALPPPAAEREKLILFVGRVVPEKAPDVFVAACAAALPRLPGWGAAIIGADRFRDDSPDTGFVRSVRAAATAAGVALLGYRDHPAVLDAMARAAMLVMPSRWQEPFGLTALEAMASGAALVASPRGGLPEVGGETALYADPDDPPAFAAAILALATNPAHLAAQAAAGRARARRFDLPPTAAMLHALRRDILAAGG